MSFSSCCPAETEHTAASGGRHYYHLASCSLSDVHPSDAIFSCPLVPLVPRDTFYDTNVPAAVKVVGDTAVLK